MSSRRICAYCGKGGAKTTDHVIPKLLFEKPYPPNLITVKAHRSCNEEKKADDELLRDCIVSDIAGGTHPDAAELFNGKVRRAIRRNQSEWARIVQETGKVKPLYTRGGIYLGNAGTAQLPDGRMERIFSRITRGLYFHYTVEVIPLTYATTLFRIMPWDFERVFEGFKKFRFAPCGPLGDVFAGGCARAAEDQFTTAWLLTFYERVHFAAFVAPPKLRSEE